MSIISESISQIIAENGWPPVTCRFAPVVHQEQWVCTSDIGILLARRLSRAPEQIVATIVSGLHKRSLPGVSALGGYLALRPLRYTLPSFEHIRQKVPQQSERRLVIVVPDREYRYNISSMVRLAALGLAQARLAVRMGIPVDLSIGSQKIENLGTDEGCCVNLERIHRECFLIVRPQQENTKLLLERLDAQTSDFYSFFLPPDNVDTRLFVDGARSIDFDCRVAVTIPERVWFAGVDAIPNGLDVSSVAHSIALLYHLTGDSRGIDIEWECYRLKERKNLIWVIDTITRRLDILSRSIPNEPFMAPFVLPESIPESVRFILHYLELFHERAARYGAVSNLIEAMRTICDYVSRELNRPEQRMALAQGDRTVSQHYQMLVEIMGRIKLCSL